MNPAARQTAGLKLTLVIHPATPEHSFYAVLSGKGEVQEFSSPQDLIRHLERLLLGQTHLR